MGAESEAVCLSCGGTRIRVLVRSRHGYTKEMRIRGVRLLVATVVVAVLAGALYWYFRPVSRELVGGGVVSNPFEPPDFTLTDQFERDQRPNHDVYGARKQR